MCMKLGIQLERKTDMEMEGLFPFASMQDGFGVKELKDSYL